jgi:zinc and cadmium transporter
MTPPLLVAFYAALTLVASLIGGWIPLLARMTHARTQVMMSLVAGLMLGVGVFHMLPHAYAQLGSLDQAVWWLMVGLLGTFFLQRFFHFHQHEAPEALLLDSEASGRRQVPVHGHAHGNREHDHQHDHCDHSHHNHNHAGHSHGKPAMGWMGIAIGLVIHTIMDGVALAAAVESESHVHGATGLAGLGVFLAIFLHKPLDAMAITALMLRDGWSARSRHLVNLGFSLVCPLGAALFYIGVSQMSGAQTVAVGCALAMSAGVFLCISLGDLLPELQFHSHDRVKLSAALMAGVALAYGIVFLEESGHEHLHGPGTGHVHGLGGHDGHSHQESGDHRHP